MMRPLAALLALLTLALAACGGDDGGASTTPSVATTATPAASRRPSPAPGVPVEQLAYIGPDGEIRLVNADGSGDHVFNDTACVASPKAMDFSMSWSPDGAALAYPCYSELTLTTTLLVLGRDGAELARVEDIDQFRWSPDGARIAYQDTAVPVGGFVVRLLDVATGQTRDAYDDAVLLGWVGPDTLLLGLSPVSGEFAMEFKAFLVDIVSGENTPVPRLDNVSTAWVSPDGAKMIVITDQRDPNGSAPGMAVYDFAQDLAVVIKGGYIGYPSEGIPRHQLAFSPDGASIYWANAAGTPASLWQAALDAPVATRLGEVDSLFVAVAPSGLVAFSEQGPVAELGIVVIEDLAAGARVEIGRAPLSFAWRPASVP